MTPDTDVVSLPEKIQAQLLALLEANELELPLLPNVAWELMELCETEDVDAQRITNIILPDQALASHILRIANSPAYRPTMPIISLPRAVSRLGTRQLCEIAIAVAVRSRLFAVPGYEYELLLLWDHALGTALYAREIARVRRRGVEGAFLCGLLHDIGKPVILQTLTDLQQDIGPLEPSAVEAIIEKCHTQVGQHLATQWKLAPQVHACIAYHHNSLQAPTYLEEVMVTCLADVLSYCTVLPEHWEEEHVRTHPTLPTLQLTPEHIDALLAKRAEVRQLITWMG
jgi:putative nucleotidyltransferase with HDIG domain